MPLTEQWFNGTGWVNLDRSGATPQIRVPYATMNASGLQFREIDESGGCIGTTYQQEFSLPAYDTGVAANMNKSTIDTAFSSGYGLVYSSTRYTDKSAWQTAVISGENPSIITYNDTDGEFKFTRGANTPPTNIQMYRPTGVPVNDGSSDMTDAEIDAALAADGITYNSTNYTDLATFTAAVIANETDLDAYDATTGEFIETSTSAPAQVSVTITTATKEVLFIVDYISSTVTPEERDTDLTTILEANGYNVTYQGDQIATTGDASGKDLILISALATHSNMDSLYASTAVPLLSMSADSAVGHGLISAAASTGSETVVSIDDNTHPITDAFSTGNLTVLTSGTGLLGAASANIGSGTALASDDDTSDTKVVVAWDSGVAMNSGNAPAKRAICFITGAGGKRLATDGESLFLDCCNWLTA